MGLLNKIFGTGSQKVREAALADIAGTLQFTPPAEASAPISPATTQHVMREAYGTTIDDDDNNWRPLSGDGKRDLTPMTQSRMREMAVYLWESNLLANRLIELPLAYILAEGVELKCEDEETQKVLDEFWADPINQMDIKLPKKVRELALYGEQCYPTFVNKITGKVRLGYLDPANINTVVYDPDNSEQAIGVVTHKDRKGVAKKYRVIINGGEDVFTERTQAIRANDFKDGEAFFFKINDLSNGHRGRSDLLAQADWIDGYDQFLFGELDRVQFLRAFMWDVTITGATPEEIKTRAKEITAPSPNSVRLHNENEKWDAVNPTLQSADTDSSARLFRNHVLGGATISSTWYGGGEDANRATAGEMAEPTFKIFSMRQRFIKHVLEFIGKYAARQRYLAIVDSEPAYDDPMLKVVANFPEMISKDISKYAAALQQVVVACSIALEKKLIDQGHAIKIIKTVAERLGMEIDEDEAIRMIGQEASAKAETDVFVEPPATELNQTKE